MSYHIYQFGHFDQIILSNSNNKKSMLFDLLPNFMCGNIRLNYLELMMTLHFDHLYFDLTLGNNKNWYLKWMKVYPESFKF